MHTAYHKYGAVRISAILFLKPKILMLDFVCSDAGFAVGNTACTYFAVAVSGTVGDAVVNALGLCFGLPVGGAAGNPFGVAV